MSALFKFSLFISKVKLLHNLLTLVADASFDSPCKTEVTYFDGTVLSNKHISWFEITVQDLAFMHMLDSVKQIPQNGLNMDQFEIHVTFHQFFEVALTIFEDHVDFVEVCIVVRYK